MDAAKGDDVRVGFGCLEGEAEGVTHEIGEFLNFALLVIVGEDDSVPLVFEFEDFFG